MPNIQWTSVIVAVGLWAVVRLWLSWSARRRAAQAGDSKVVIRLSPRVIFGFLIALGVVVPLADYAMNSAQGKAVSIDDTLLNIVFGALGGAILGGVVWLTLWLIGKFRRKDPSKHF